MNFRHSPQVDADGNPVEGQEELAKIILQQQQLQVEGKQPAEKRGIKQNVGFFLRLPVFVQSF